MRRVAVLGVLLAIGARASVVYERQRIPLATPITIDGIAAWVGPDDLKQRSLELFLSVNSGEDDWTLAAGDLYLTDGSARWNLRKPLFPPAAANLGPLARDQVVTLTFALPATLDAGRPLSLVIAGGVYAWRGDKDRDKFSLSLWRGLRARVAARMDAVGRMCTVDASESTGDIATYEFAAESDRVFVSTQPVWRVRVPANGAVAGRLTVRARNGATEAADFSVRRGGSQAPLPEEVLVGVCFYPEEELSGRDIDGLEARGKREWEAPYRRERHPPGTYMRRAMEEELGNLFVIWPEVQKTAKWSDADEEKWVADLAGKRIHYMTIYQNAGRDAARRLAAAGGGRCFLGNNLGEYASYLYQGADSARACGVPQEGDLEACRDWFVNTYIAKGAKEYHRSYDRVFSTSGAALGAYELAGGIDVMASELYAIGAANLAYATAEMRGAARKWKPVYWGGWLAHEWQTVSVPFQAAEKFPLLRAGLYQQFLMGSSMIVLESGSQTTQAGFHTKDSGRRNFTYSEDPPTRYRTEMKEFHRYVKTHPRPAGPPETRVAVALGHCDSFVGTYIDGLPQWSQFETAKKNPNWLYGTPERSWQVVQSVLFPTPARAVGDYKNAWLAGSPLGQADIVQIDRTTVPEDLQPYRAIAYAGWNSMNETIADTLRKYVGQGGRLLLCMPHLSVRLDREYRDYGVADLFGKGDLSWLLPVKVKGRAAVAGKVGFADGAFGIPAGEATAPLTGERLAQIEAGAGVVTVCADAAGAPVVVRCPVGAGEVVLVLTWEYPGHPSIAPLYAHLLNAFVAGERGEVHVTERGERAPRYDGPETSSISYAVYADRIYLLNMDTRAPHTFDLHEGDRVSSVTLKPVEFREVERRP